MSHSLQKYSFSLQKISIPVSSHFRGIPVKSHFISTPVNSVFRSTPANSVFRSAPPFFSLHKYSLALFPFSPLVLFPPLIVIIIIYPLTARVFGASQMISQPDSSIFLCSALPSGTWWTPGLSIPLCCLPTSSSVCPVFFALSLCLARWFWPDLINGKHEHTTAVCVFLWSSGDLHVVQLPAGSWHGLPRW